MRRLLFILTITLMSAQSLVGQDAQFSQFYSSPLYLGPSFAGATGQSRIIANYRNQWVSLPSAYSTYAFSFDHFVDKYRSGVGLLLFNDQEGGTYNSTIASLSYSYMIDINEKIKMRPGLQAAYYSRHINYGDLRFADAIMRNSGTSIETPVNENVSHYDFAFSVITYTDNMWIGATGNHLLALNKQFADDYSYPSLKLTAFGGMRYKFAERVRTMEDKFLSLSFFFKHQAGFHQLDVGANYEQDPFRIGLWFRGVPALSESADLNAVVLLVGTTIKDLFINYSYDISTSRLLSATGGAHEISIAYRFDMGIRERKKKSALPCPHF
ncbi:MAG: type IX secretion system membrane protein PorP/SprF [Bacteroidales bacterium]